MKKEAILKLLLGGAISALLAVGCGMDGVEEDKTPPVITLSGSPTMSITKGSTFVDPGATAMDAVDGEVSIIVRGEVNSLIVGEYTLTYFAIDSSGNSATKNRKITVTKAVDTTPPVVAIVGDKNITVMQYTSFDDPGATAVDNVDGNISSRVKREGFNGDVVGTYTVTYSVKDSSGNIGSDTRIVTVEKFTITHNGTTYEAVKSPYTGRVFLDRNLGAAEVCTNYDDDACYGDYYQWGRPHDGHEAQNSNTTDDLAEDPSVVGHGFFISSEDSARDDWTADGTDANGSIRISNWLKVDGSSVCPLGFRAPSLLEMEAELTGEGSAEIQKNNAQKEGNSDDRRVNAFNTFLKLPISGYRDFNDASYTLDGVWGGVWLVNDDGGTGGAIIGVSADAVESSMDGLRAEGAPVRCIKD